MLPGKSKAVTQADIATLVGVTQRTVSRCFLQPGAVEPGILGRVTEAARKAGYHPNRAARIIRGGRSERVTLLHDAGASDPCVHAMFLLSVHQCLRDCHLNLSLEDLPSGAGRVSHSDLHMSDGVMVACHSGLSGEADAQVRRLSVPVVWVNTHGAHNGVCPDDQRAGREATEHLLHLGHRRIAFVDQPECRARVRLSPSAYCNCAARLAGYREAMSAAGLRPWLVQAEAGETLATALGVYRRLLLQSDRPTGLVVCRKRDAQAAVFATHTWRGLEVPRDLSIVTFTEDLPWTYPRLTAWVTPWKSMGKAAVEMLVDRMRRPESDWAHRWLPMERVEGVTCGKPPC
ncbi:MAG: LacI family DNA-binding transcriptional regulator [bacterium]